MDNSRTSLDLGKAKISKKKYDTHIPSKVQADTLFTFTTQLDYLIDSIKNSMLSPRYCEEDISYLKINRIKKIAFPMKCFCDINIHRLENHLAWYGYYGLAFSKEWGMINKIQPVQYINPSSLLCKDFAQAFRTALGANNTKQTRLEKNLKDYTLHQLMYYKPYSGKMENRNTGRKQKKCFTDESEWRYIPDVTKIEFPQVISDKHVLTPNVLRDFSNSMANNPTISLKFDYSDLKYIIVKSLDDFRKLSSVILGQNLEPYVKYTTLAKVIIWDTSKEDF